MRIIAAPADARPETPTTAKDWRDACAIAHAMLCLGQASALPGEPWVAAIGRTAGGLLASRGFGLAEGAAARPMGIPNAWVRTLREIASQSSTAPDGCVQVGTKRIPLDMIPRGL